MEYLRHLLLGSANDYIVNGLTVGSEIKFLDHHGKKVL